MRALVLVLTLVSGLVAPAAAVAGRDAMPGIRSGGKSGCAGRGCRPPRAAALGPRLGVARHLLAAVGARTGIRVTHERVVGEVAVAAMPLDVGVTVSQLEKVRTMGGPEIVHVVAPDGATNLELVLTRVPLWRGQFLELQGPAINRDAGGRIGFRAAGVAITRDLDERGSIKAASYTAEVKLTERGAGRLALAVLPDGVRLAAIATGGVVGEVLAMTVPGLTIALAARSAWLAWRTLRDPTAGRRERLLASGHAVADAVRVVLPMVGVVANLALVVGNAAYELGRLRGRSPLPAPGSTSTDPPSGAVL